MATAVKIEKIVIDVADSKLELSVDQAGELRDILVDLLGHKSATLDDLQKQLDKMGRERIYQPIPIPIPMPYRDPWWSPIWYSTSSGTSIYSGTVQLSCAKS